MAELYSHRANTAFDVVALRYDELWTCSTVGRLQRDAVAATWTRFFTTGDELLDLGCGTGEDAIHLEALGAKVFAIDASPEMVRVARTRGANASVLSIEDLAHIKGHFDGVVSNFGALNCVGNLKAVSASLAKLVLPGRYLAVCVLGRFCLWETLWYLLTGHPRKAFRRLRAEERLQVSWSPCPSLLHSGTLNARCLPISHWWSGVESACRCRPLTSALFRSGCSGYLVRSIAVWLTGPCFAHGPTTVYLCSCEARERRPSRRAHPAWRNPLCIRWLAPDAARHLGSILYFTGI